MSRGDTRGGSRPKVLPEQWPRGVSGWRRRKGCQKSRFRVEKWVKPATPDSTGFVPRACSGVTVGPCLMLFLSLRLLHGPQVIEKFDYVFAENGTVQYKHGRLLSKQVSGMGLSRGTPLFPAGPFCLACATVRALCCLHRRSRTTWGRSYCRT